MGKKASVIDPGVFRSRQLIDLRRSTLVVTKS